RSGFQQKFMSGAGPCQIIPATLFSKAIASPRFGGPPLADRLLRSAPLRRLCLPGHHPLTGRLCRARPEDFSANGWSLLATVFGSCFTQETCKHRLVDLGL